ncbi:hypothetical protein MycrhDRAFT_5120 [Mycolicibacterium rhodesiae JS60]|nr:hypothetical protein MycrhDRAFT_5120 [Mycolicibacterium rhodesiae JS60]
MPVSRPAEALKRLFVATRQNLVEFSHASERSLLLGTVLVASMVSVATGIVLTQYYSADVLSSLLFPPDDCWLGMPTNFGRHCFNDYTIVVVGGTRPNPWEPYYFSVFWQSVSPPNNYPAAGMVPQVAFGLLGNWVGAPRLGLLGYLTVLTIACFTPALWAARGARGLERLVVFAVCAVAAIPAWIAIDRGNSVGFTAPIVLAFLVALCRQRWGLATIMVVLAALVKPHFVVLAVVLLAARQWRAGIIAVAGAALANLAAYLLWPQDFPATIWQSMRGILGYGNAYSYFDIGNISFAKALLLPLDQLEMARMAGGGALSDHALAGPRSLIGYAILAIVVVSVLVLGKRIPPVMAGVVVLATISLFPAVTARYYLIFALPVAALILRDPQGPPGSGIFDRYAMLGDRRRTVGICASLSAALSIALIAIPIAHQMTPTGQAGVTGIVRTTPVFATTATLTPLMWLATCALIIISYARRPTLQPADVDPQGRNLDVPTAVESDVVSPSSG